MLKPKLGYTPSTTLTFKTSLGTIYFSEALNTVGDVTDAKKKKSTRKWFSLVILCYKSSFLLLV